MKIFQGFRKAVLPVHHQTEKMKRFRMVRGKLEGLPVGSFGFHEATGLLERTPLLKASVERRHLVGLASPSCGFLTPSLGSIHDASATGLEGSRNASDRSKGRQAIILSPMADSTMEHR
jgi:hypothetical protein